jgi:hypothetical protein
MTVADLKKALASRDGNDRAEALRAFRDADYDTKALPLLRRALNDKYVEAVIEAAACIGKLGPDALASPAAETPMRVGEDEADLVTQLTLAGAKVWGYSGYPNAYSACLDALVKLGADGDVVTEFVHNHIGLTNPDDLLDSVRALLELGTPEARDLVDRAAAFWAPELNKGHAKKLAALRSSRK